MAHVIILDSIKQDIFVCGLCKSVFYSLVLFLDHKKLKCTPEESENTSVITELAPLGVPLHSVSSSDTMIISQEEESARSLAGAKNFVCSLCEKKFKTRKTLGAHIKSHYTKPYQCLVCGRCFMQNSHLERHILSHKAWPDSLSETTAKTADVDLLSYSCPYCDLIFSNYNQFRSHLKNHQDMKKFKCIQSNCIYFFETMESLLQHVSSCHVEPVYSCHICDKTYNSLDSVATHQQSHNDNSKADAVREKRYKCLQCDAIFKKPEKLSLHMLTENHNKICIHCNKSFASDKRLRLHLQIHREVKPYHCDICDSSFHMKKYLTTHMLKHGQKDFKCHICKTMFKRQDLLQRHMKLHTNNKFKCPFKDALDCNKEFSRRDKLKLHIKSHSKYVATISTNTQDDSKACTLMES